MPDMFEDYRPLSSGQRGRVTTRPMLRADLDACVRLALARNGGDADAWLARFRRDLDADDRAAFVAAADGRFAGYATLAHLRMGGPDDEPSGPPEGWYLTGLVVTPDLRRRGVGTALTSARMAWLSGRADVVWYFANSVNRATIDLHAALGFREVRRDVRVPGVTFEGGSGILFAAPVPAHP